ncbi:GGDEF domain-containing protein [Paenibacillus marchantiophytorum]|uniref:GGDEF domain-containing protein n=1 Tax=Paenibacillus marchantiophytorum TaxID=1619310 RepID=A0ABQ1FG33_9BACL|nr:GGDEF domain-containing protein [Paenibacillus marchantiophytorum]GGA10906.1 GGDEF domain-containing protein [Paenibacillus marchantiophytorum]
MKRSRSSVISDGAFLLLILACFVSIVFTAGNPNLYIQNIIFLNLAFLIAVVTYFTSVTTGLILNILFIFGYGTFTLYQTVVVGGLIGTQNYFWLIMTPLFTLATWLLTLGNRQLQQENEQLVKVNESLATVDARTSLKNTLSFQSDASVFMALSARYNIPLTLLVISVKYWDEIRRMIGEEQLLEAVHDLSKMSQISIRTNDSLYLLNKENPMWGMILFTDLPGAMIVIDRLRSRVDERNRDEFAQKYRVELILKMGAVAYDAEQISNPLEFIAQAKKQVEYDV